MNYIAFFCGGFVPGVVLGSAVAFDLARTTRHAVEAGNLAGMRLGAVRRAALVLLAFWIGSRCGIPGLLGAFGGIMAGLVVVIGRHTGRAADGR